MLIYYEIIRKIYPYIFPYSYKKFYIYRKVHICETVYSFFVSYLEFINSVIKAI